MFHSRIVCHVHQHCGCEPSWGHVFVCMHPPTYCMRLWLWHVFFLCPGLPMAVQSSPVLELETSVTKWIMWVHRWYAKCHVYINGCYRMHNFVCLLPISLLIVGSCLCFCQILCVFPILKLHTCLFTVCAFLYTCLSLFVCCPLLFVCHPSTFVYCLLFCAWPIPIWVLPLLILTRAVCPLLV